MAYIPKTNIVNGNTIQTSDITNIIDSLNQTGSYSVIATGSFSGSLVGAGTITGSLSGSFNGIISSSITSGSFSGNVIALSISSGTASLNCSLGNFFTLNASGSSVYISASNIQPGQTINFKLVNGSPTSSIYFLPGQFYYSSGSYYTASVGTDILTFISFDGNTRLYSTNLNNFQSY